MNRTQRAQIATGLLKNLAKCILDELDTVEQLQDFESKLLELGAKLPNSNMGDVIEYVRELVRQRSPAAIERQAQLKRSQGIRLARKMARKAALHEQNECDHASPNRNRHYPPMQ